MIGKAKCMCLVVVVGIILSLDGSSKLVRVFRKEVLWSERGGCLSGKKGSCPAHVVEAVTRIIDIGSIAVLWSRGLSCFDDLTAEPDVFSEIGYEGIIFVDQGYIYYPLS